MMIRGIVKSVIEGMIKRFAASGLIDVADREYIQHYGFTSRPKEGAEIVYLVEGNVTIALGSDDRRYRLKIEAGETALYDDFGQKVHLTRDGIVIKSPQIILDGHVKTTNHLTVSSGDSGVFTDKVGKTITVKNGIIVGGVS